MTPEETQQAILAELKETNEKLDKMVSLLRLGESEFFLMLEEILRP